MFRRVALPFLLVVAAVSYLLWPAGDGGRADRGERVAGEGRAAPVGEAETAVATEEAPASETNAPSTSPTGDAVDWRVRVVDRFDRAVPDLILAFDEPARTLVTDADGRVVTSAPRDRETLGVRVPALGVARTLRSREAVVRLGHVVPVEIVWVRAADGERIVDGEVTLVRSDGNKVAVPPREGALRTHAVPGESLRVRVVRAPDGFGVASPWIEGLGPVSRFAERVVVQAPVWPELDLTVRPSPAAGARVVRARFAGRAIPIRSRAAGADGTLRVHGVPHLHGERLSLEIEAGDLRGEVEVVIDRATLTAQVELTELAPLGIGGGAGTGLSGRSGRRVKPPPGAGTVGVAVLRADGGPAADARVRLLSQGEAWTIRRTTRTDERGLVLFRGVPPATYLVAVEEPGFVYTAEEIVVADSVRVTLQEPRGWTARVRVVDAEGRPAAGARLRVTPERGPRHLLLEHGVQTMPILTNPFGEATVPGLPHTPVEIKAYLGSRHAEATLQEGSAPVRLTLTGGR